MDPILAAWRRESALKALVPLFFVSGATSLVYESIWGRSLHLVFGTSQVAIATVLAAFMGGLSLGAVLMARWADRVRRPLLVYGLIEAGIGLYALLFPFLLDMVAPLYLGLWRLTEPSPLVFAGYQAVLVGILLVVPTTLMGATLPLLARFVTTRMDLAGRRVGLLYGVNTLGAVAGVFLAGFYLLPSFGLTRTTVAAAAANILLCGLAVLLSRRSESGELPQVEAASGPPHEPGRQGTILAVAGLSGFAALVYELAWFRLMTLTLGGSAYAFTLMLLAFLAGMGVGGLVGGSLADRLLEKKGVGGVVLGLALSQLGVAVLTYGMMRGYGELPFLYVSMYSTVEGSWSFFWPAQLLLAGGIMAPPALLMGVAFTMATRALVADPARLGGPVGLVYGVNTMGGIMGVLLAAFIFLPRLQVTGTVLVGVGVNVLAALLALRMLGRLLPARRSHLRWGAVAVVLLFGAGLAYPPRWDPLLMTAGMYKYVTELSDRSRAGVRRYAVEPYELLFYAEGLSSVVTVAKNRKTDNIWLANNGKVDASTTSDMPTQILVAHLPFFFRPEARTACVIGLASGITAGAVTLHGGLEAVDLVELEPAIFEASRFFDDHNHRPLEDPRVRSVVNDGRNHMMLTPPGTYDVVVSEPSNPWLTGVSNLFTLEFFRESSQRLAPGGIWSQWIQLYGMGAEELRALLRAFSEVFPRVLVFAPIEDADLVVLGSHEPLEMDLERMKMVMDDSRVAQDLKAAGVEEVFDLLTFYQMDRAALDEFVLGASMNTDDNMLVEFMAPRRLYEETSTRNYRVMLHEARPALAALRGLDDYRALADAYARRGELVRALVVLKAADATFPGDQEVARSYAEYQAAFLVDQGEL